MNLGIRYTLPEACYPRYSYFKTWTEQLLPTFKDIIDKNNLHECICNGSADLRDIMYEANRLKQPIVTVFANPEGWIRSLGKAVVQSMEPFRQEKMEPFRQEKLVSDKFRQEKMEPFRQEKLVSEKLSWNELLSEGSASSEFDSKILVVIMEPTDSETYQMLSELSTAQQESTIIYNPREKTHRLFKQSSDFETPQPLSLDIQGVLELKFVRLLSKVAGYLEPLVPRDATEPEKTFLDDMKDKLRSLEICCVKEILNPKQTDYSMDDLHGRHGNNREEEEKKGRIKMKEKKTDQPIKVKELTIKDHPFAQKLQNKQIEMLTQLIGRRMKCQMVEHLSMKYGIRSMVTTTFLTSHLFYNFDEKYTNWIRKNGIDKLDTAERLLDTCNMSPFILEVEEFIKLKYRQLDAIQKQQFEVFGLLRETNFKTNVRDDARLNPELQDALLQLPEVIGCGTIYGILTLHAQNELSLDSKCTVKDLLHMYNYHRGYRVNSVPSIKLQMGGYITVDNGYGLRAEVCQEQAHSSGDKQNLGMNQQYKHGTLGCYVMVKQKPNDAASSRDVHQLCCITCRHCVSDCKPEIKTIDDNKEIFAMQTDYFIGSGERFDVALLKINKNSTTHTCDLMLKKQVNDSVFCCPWEVLQGEVTSGKHVYMFGYISKYKRGIVASSDYKERGIKEMYDKKSKTTDPSGHLHPSVNLIIASRETNGDNVGADQVQDADVIQFSQKGDSGSVICGLNKDNLNVTAISILHGSFDRNGQWVFSYSALLSKTFEELEQRFNIEIRPPVFRKSDTVTDPFMEDENLEDVAPLTDSEQAGESMEIQQAVQADGDAAASGDLPGSHSTDQSGKLYYKQSVFQLTFPDGDGRPQTSQQTIRQCRKFSKDSDQ